MGSTKCLVKGVCVCYIYVFLWKSLKTLFTFCEKQNEISGSTAATTVFEKKSLASCVQGLSPDTAFTQLLLLLLLLL